MNDKNKNSSEVPWNDIVRVAAKVAANDSERVQRINSAILKIDEAIESGQKDQLMYVNAAICFEFPKIVFASDSCIERVTCDFMEKQALYIQIESLRTIVRVLHKAKLAEKVVQVVQEGGKVALENIAQKGIKAVLGMFDGN